VAAADSALRVKRREEACMLGTPEVERKKQIRCSDASILGKTRSNVCTPHGVCPDSLS